MNMLRKFSVFTVIILLFTLFSCYDYDEDKNCTHEPADCRKTPFTTGDLKIKFTLNELNPTVTIWIYEGDYDPDKNSTPKYTIGIARGADSPYCRSYTPVGKYSARISYLVDGGFVEAIDGGSIESNAESYCEGKCYEIQTPTLDCSFDEKAYNEFKSGSDKKCFIATAFYGSSDNGKVIALRKFRDRYLKSSRWGKSFVSWYYRNSPPAAELIRKHESARFAAGIFLVPLVFLIEHPLAVTLLPIAVVLLIVILLFRRRYRTSGI
jgi:hypothetical protein